MQLDMILTSLQDNGHVAVLLGFARPTEPVTSSSNNGNGAGVAVSQSSIQLAEMLMKTLLRNLAFHSVSTVCSLLHLSLMVRLDGFSKLVTRCTNVA